MTGQAREGSGSAITRMLSRGTRAGKHKRPTPDSTLFPPRVHGHRHAARSRTNGAMIAHTGSPCTQRASNQLAAPPCSVQPYAAQKTPYVPPRKHAVRSARGRLRANHVLHVRGELVRRLELGLTAVGTNFVKKSDGFASSRTRPISHSPARTRCRKLRWSDLARVCVRSGRRRREQLGRTCKSLPVWPHRRCRHRECCVRPARRLSGSSARTRGQAC